MRHVEDGHEAASRRRSRAPREIGFTIISISISLVAVFIPLLLMGGIIGRLFREFAVTTTDVHRRVGLRRADADADDGLALPASRGRGASTAASTTSRERGFDALLHGYERGLDFVLRHHFATLCVFLATLAAHRSICSSIIPKGFFPQQDTGLITGISEAGAGRLVRRHDAPPGGAGRDRRQGSGRRDRRHGASAPAAQRRAQQRPLVHHAEAARASATRPPARSSRGCGRSSRRSRARGCSCRRRRT